MLQNNSNRHILGSFNIPSDNYHKSMLQARDVLIRGTGEGSNMRGWIYWPLNYLVSNEYSCLKATAKNIIETNDAVVICGIGGSYLTPKMLIESEYGEFYNESAETGSTPKMYFAGCDLSPDRLNYIINAVSGKNWSIIYISKSGNTVEPALAFRILYDSLSKQFGSKADKHVYAITDAHKGTLNKLANEHGWITFHIPEYIGGRYSAFTACGLLPTALAGIDTDDLIYGAISAISDFFSHSNGFACTYAEWRFYNYTKLGNSVEFFAVNTPYLSYLTEWLKQLFGESEGKDGKGLFPASGVFPTDLHSLGQYLQDGLRNTICETFIERDKKTDIKIPQSSLADNLDIRAGKDFSQAISAGMAGALSAHISGGNACSNIRIGNSLEDMGYFMQSMFFACGISSYMLHINPFNQPGVELHKINSSKWDD